MSNFSFVADEILRSNLDLAFNHIVDLLALSESAQYKRKPLLVSSLRKTIIIHTASIVEALLLWELKRVSGTNKIELVDEWRYFDMRNLYKISASEEVVAGLRRKEKREMDKLDFLRVIDLCVKHKIIRSAGLSDDIHEVRKLRNRLHIGGLPGLEREYTKTDLEFCFSVAKRVKRLLSK